VRQYWTASEKKLSFAPESECIHWAHPAGYQEKPTIELNLMGKYKRED